MGATSWMKSSILDCHQFGGVCLIFPPGAAARRIVILAVLRLEDEKIGVVPLRDDIAGREKQAAPDRADN